MGFSRQEYWSGQPFPSPVVTSLSLWKPRMPFSGYFFPQFTISMKASACSCHLLCCMPRFRDTTDSAGKGLVCKQRTKEERVDDQSAEDWEEAEIWPALASREPWSYSASKDSLVSPQFLCGIEALLSWSTKSPLGQFPGGGLHGPLSPAPLGYMPSLSPPPLPDPQTL